MARPVLKIMQPQNKEFHLQYIPIAIGTDLINTKMKIMQRFLLSLLILLGSSSLFAQSIEDIEGQLAKGELDKAKASVDAFLTKEKNASKPDGCGIL